LTLSNSPSLLSGLPPFDQIKPEHFKPAFDIVLQRHMDEVKAIATNSSSPSFDNTILALDKAGGEYVKINYLFSNLCSSVTTPALQAVEVLMSPILAAHENKVSNYPGLFPRVDAVHSSLKASDLDDEAKRLTERIHLDFVRAGARFDEAKQKQNAKIVQKLASLETEFAQNVLKDEEVTIGPLTEQDMVGCPDDLKQAAREAAASLGHKEGYIISLSRSLVEPFLTFADRRDLREAAWLKWTKRGELDPSRDNRKIAKEILLLRSKQAELHGYKTFADYQTADMMAKSPDKVLDLLNNVWEKAKASANAEREALEAFVAAIDSNPLQGSRILPWDWRYYAEKVRSAKYDFDEALLKPYFSLKAVTNAAFDCAGKLFGLMFVEKPEVSAYHPDVKVYEVREEGPDGEDKLRAIFLHDNFMRQGKRSGAWMSELRGALPCEGIVPVIINNNNFAKGPDNGQGSLLSYDDARTLFHEFGHGLHGMLSEAKFHRLAGTNVLRDFVELPSQLMEHWVSEPQVLKQHALHIETQAPIPDELLDRLKAARNYGQGFATIEYTSSALVDQALHALPRTELEALDLAVFEREELARLQMPQGIIMRHRPAHFQHLFASSSYASAYYVYLWAEVLDADGFDAFKVDKKDIFDPETAKRLRRFIYSSGNTLEPGAAYRAFRGRDPVVEPMLAKKGLLATV
jgi:peptidyl-dipeptidase Dcp